MLVADTTSCNYRSNFLQPQDVQVIRTLLKTLLGSEKLAKSIVQSIIDNGQVSPYTFVSNLRDYIQNDNLLTPKQLEVMMACLTLVKYLKSPSASANQQLDDAEKVSQMLQPYIGWEKVEKFAVISLDSQLQVSAIDIISSGSCNETIADPKEIFRKVILRGGTRCMVAHNHPSGDTNPSEEDLVLTKHLIQAGKVINCPLVDHLVISMGNYHSIRSSLPYWDE
jgi:DNA repair protein RadC